MDFTDELAPGIDRRRLLEMAAVIGAALPFATPASAQTTAPAPAPAAGKAPVVALLVHPKMVMIDLIGPLSVFNMMGAKLHLVWKDLNPVMTEVRIPVTPTNTFADCPRDVDVLFLPGGLEGSIALMDDPQTLAFLNEIGARARYVTSVCTGSLVLAAAGLLRGYRATSLWYVRDALPLMGATLAHERVVTDRNRITGAGATAGLDFGLQVAETLVGRERAERIQLILEYDPHPPLNSGSPEKADKALTQSVLTGRGAAIGAAMAKAQIIQKATKA